MLVAIYAKIVPLRQLSKTLYWFFYLSSANENLETGIQVWFEQLKKLKQFWGAFTG